MNFSFYKLVGAGNDFIFIDSACELFEKLSQSPEDQRKFVRKISHRRWGVGADGVVFLKAQNTNSKTPPFIWDFYNSDGSPADMCGNAARCVVVYNFHLHQSQSCELQTSLGPVKGEFFQGEPQVSWSLNDPRVGKKNLSVGENSTLDVWMVNPGVPHFVILVDEFPGFEEKTLRTLQEKNIFSPQGVNITLLSLKKQGPHLFQTFERGVKNFTLSCGTGALAASLVLQKLSPQDSYHLKSPGGDLKVQILKDSRVRLRGPAFISFKGQNFYEGGD